MRSQDFFTCLFRHTRESGYPYFSARYWVLADAGMTKSESSGSKKRSFNVACDASRFPSQGGKRFLLTLERDCMNEQRTGIAGSGTYLGWINDYGAIGVKPTGGISGAGFHECLFAGGSAGALAQRRDLSG